MSTQPLDAFAIVCDGCKRRGPIALSRDTAQFLAQEQGIVLLTQNGVPIGHFCARGVCLQRKIDEFAIDRFHRRAEQALGWKEGESASFSLLALRDLLHPVAPKLAFEITQLIQSGRVLLEEDARAK